MARIHCRELGNGFPLVFIHGFCETSEVWADFADRFGHEFHVIVLDLPGFGKSEALPAPFTLEGVAQQLIDFLASKNIDHYCLIGHSLGGYVSLAMAALQPNAVHSVVLFHSTALDDSTEKKENRNKVIDFVRANGVAPFVETFIPGLFYDKSHPAISTLHQIANQTDKNTLISYTQAMRDRPSRIQLIQDYKKPTLLLGGQFDPIIPASSLQDLAAKSGAEVAFLDKTAHMGMLEAPIEAYRIIYQFLKHTS